MNRPTTRIHDFYSLFVELKGKQTDLPFEIGGATQMGQLGDHHNNQDAVAILSERGYLIAVVSDGCASGGARSSHNEIGAKLQSLLLASMLDEALSEGGVHQLPPKLHLLEERLLADIRKIVATLSAHPRGPSKAELGQCLFTATLLAAVVDDERYLVFGCGDGVLRVNHTCIDLDDHEGRYLSERLNDESPTQVGQEIVPNEQIEAPIRHGSSTQAYSDPKTTAEQSIKKHGTPMMRVLSEGLSADLSQIFLATDGFLDIFDKYPTLLERMASTVSHPQEGIPGYNENLVSEFRRKFWYDEDVEAWASDHGSHDDRSFALIRRATKPVTGRDVC